MSWHIYGADSIVIPVISGGDEVPVRRAGRMCDGPGSMCAGGGARGVFGSPVAAGFTLCPACLLRVRQRGLE